MTNNEVLINIQKVFDYDNEKVVEILKILNRDATLEQVNLWSKKPGDTTFVAMDDFEMATFLNALICERRGKKDGPQPTPENEITNNTILKKLKIALDLKNEAILEIFKAVDMPMNNYELTSFFRKPDHKNFRPIKDQALRGFIKGLDSLPKAVKS